MGAASAKVAQRPADSVGVSAAALKALSGGDATVASSIIDATPDIRPDRIAQVKKRIAEGYYNTPGFIDELAGKLAQEFGSKGL